MITQRLCFHPQASFGDCFVAAGAINWYSSRCITLFLPIFSKSSLLETAITLFEDNKKIKIFEYSDDKYVDLNQTITKENLTPITISNMYSMLVDGIAVHPLWDEQIYSSLDLPFSIRYSHFRLPKDNSKAIDLFNRVVRNDRYILVHQKMRITTPVIELDLNYCRSQAGLDPLDKFQIIEFDESITNNVVLYSELIKHAEEIHCVPSSIFCFVDSLFNTTSAKLFYHDVRKNARIRVNNNWNNHCWNIVHYAQQL